MSTFCVRLIRCALDPVRSVFSCGDGWLFYSDRSELRCRPVLGQFSLETGLSDLMTESVSRPPHLIKEIAVSIAVEEEFRLLVNLLASDGHRRTHGPLVAA